MSTKSTIELMISLLLLTISGGLARRILEKEADFSEMNELNEILEEANINLDQNWESIQIDEDGRANTPQQRTQIAGQNEDILSDIDIKFRRMRDQNLLKNNINIGNDFASSNEETEDPIDSVQNNIDNISKKNGGKSKSLKDMKLGDLFNKNYFMVKAKEDTKARSRQKKRYVVEAFDKSKIVSLLIRNAKIKKWEREEGKYDELFEMLSDLEKESREGSAEDAQVKKTGEKSRDEKNAKVTREKQMSKIKSSENEAELEREEKKTDKKEKAKSVPKAEEDSANTKIDANQKNDSESKKKPVTKFINIHKSKIKIKSDVDSTTSKKEKIVKIKENVGDSENQSKSKDKQEIAEKTQELKKSKNIDLVKKNPKKVLDFVKEKAEEKTKASQPKEDKEKKNIDVLEKIENETLSKEKNSESNKIKNKNKIIKEKENLTTKTKQLNDQEDHVLKEKIEINKSDTKAKSDNEELGNKNNLSEPVDKVKSDNSKKESITKPKIKDKIEEGSKQVKKNKDEMPKQVKKNIDEMPKQVKTNKDEMPKQIKTNKDEMPNQKEKNKNKTKSFANNINKDKEKSIIENKIKPKNEEKAKQISKPKLYNYNKQFLNWKEENKKKISANKINSKKRKNKLFNSILMILIKFIILIRAKMNSKIQLLVFPKVIPFFKQKMIQNNLQKMLKRSLSECAKFITNKIVLNHLIKMLLHNLKMCKNQLKYRICNRKSSKLVVIQYILMEFVKKIYSVFWNLRIKELKMFNVFQKPKIQVNRQISKNRLFSRQRSSYKPFFNQNSSRTSLTNKQIKKFSPSRNNFNKYSTFRKNKTFY